MGDLQIPIRMKFPHIKSVSGLKPRFRISASSAINGGVTETVVRHRTVGKKKVALFESNLAMLLVKVSCSKLSRIFQPEYEAFLARS